MQNKIKLGKYRHFKGSFVEVIAVASHSETLEEMVVYIHQDAIKGKKANTVWVRPLKMFTEDVKIDAKIIPRFKYIRTR